MIERFTPIAHAGWLDQPLVIEVPVDACGRFMEVSTTSIAKSLCRTSRGIFRQRR